MLGNVVGCLVRAELELCTSRAHAEVVQCVLFFLWHRAALWRRGWAAPGGAGDGLCAAAPCSITASRSKCRLPIMAEHVLSAVFVEGRRCLSVSQLLRQLVARCAPCTPACCRLCAFAQREIGRRGAEVVPGRGWCSPTNDSPGFRRSCVPAAARSECWLRLQQAFCCPVCLFALSVYVLVPVSGCISCHLEVWSCTCTADGNRCTDARRCALTAC